MPVIRGVDSVITKNLTEQEKQLGVDLKLTKTNDLELNNLKDFSLVAGGSNAAQAVKIRLGIEPRGLLYHPEIGTDLLIGEKTKDAFLIKTQIIQSLSKDDRFEDVDASVSIQGGFIFADIRVALVDTGLTVPLQFAIPA